MNDGPENIHANESELLEEARTYFQARFGFKRLWDALVEKYLHLGRLSGMVVLENVGPEERETLEGFFRRRLPGKTLRLAVSRIEQAFAQTRFGGLDLLKFLAQWHGSALVTSAEHQIKAEQKRRAVIEKFMAAYREPVCQQWLTAILDKNPQTRQVQRALAHNVDLYENMITALQALANLPRDYQRLPVFARMICGDPHGLDLGRNSGRLFLEGLRFLRNSEDGGNLDSAAESTATEELNELFFHFKLLRDDLLNLATCYGFVAYKAGYEIAYWKTASCCGAPLNVPLREIVRVTSFHPWPGPESALTGQAREFDVYVVENSGVFSTLLDETLSVHPQLLCLHGQFKLASWALLERLIQSGAMLHYSGDFDPEGLQIAEKLLRRYPGRVRLWRMTEADYYQAEPSMVLKEMRLRKLNLITSPELKPLADRMAITRMAAYQEGILEQLIRDIRES